MIRMRNILFVIRILAIIFNPSAMAGLTPAALPAGHFVSDHGDLLFNANGVDGLACPSAGAAELCAILTSETPVPGSQKQQISKVPFVLSLTGIVSAPMPHPPKVIS